MEQKDSERPAKGCWKKGALHVHTLWSDGRSLPEVALETYRGLGYDFVCLTDHNCVQDDPNVWCQVQREEGPWPPQLSEQEYKRSLAMVQCGLEEKLVFVRRHVRLRTFAELRKLFERDDFLVIPGEESTSMFLEMAEDDALHDYHFTTFNSPQFISAFVTNQERWNAVGRFNLDVRLERPTNGRTVFSRILSYYQATAPKDSLLIVAHPFWHLWDVDPRLLIDFPAIRHFEVCNSGTQESVHKDMFDVEKYWDFILAHRIDAGAPLLYGVASDDAHFYDEKRIHDICGCDTGWVMVRSTGPFTAAAMAQAIGDGDFYASTGVYLKEIVFNQRTRTLEVEVQPAPGEDYRIDFITTQKGYDRSIVEREFPYSDPRFKRRLPIVPKDVGQVVKSISGVSGKYQMQPGDLYVRAVVTSSSPSCFPQRNCYPAHKCAWVQPHR